MEYNWGALSCGLPEDILKAKWAGDFEQAQRLIDARLKDDRIPEALKECLRTEKVILERLPYDFTYTKEQALELLREKLGSFTEEEFDRLELDGKLEYIYIKGEKYYFRRFYNTLIKVYPDIAERAGIDKSTAARPTLDALIARQKRNGKAGCRLTVRHTLWVNDAYFKTDTYTFHVPIPKTAAQVREVILPELPGWQIAPDDAPQRTASITKKLEKNEKFSVEYTLDNRVVYVDPLDGKKGIAYPDAKPVCADDLKEQLPHIVFTPYMRALAKELAGDETDKAVIARRFYDFCTTKVTYSFMRCYLTIENGSEYAALNLKGDCGIQALCFITLCRIAGIPARWQSGEEFSVPNDVGNHDWAQFWLEDKGWLFADPSYGGSAYRSGRTEAWNFYFGNLEPWRIVINDVYQQGFIPAKKQVRIDPYDNQNGEIETPDRGLTQKERACSIELVSIEELY